MSHQQQQNNSFDDPLSLSLGGTFDGQPSDYINDNTPVIFDYDESTATGSVPLSLNGMLSSDESLVGLADPLANLDDMDASSAAAAAASLDAFLADQPSMSMPMMPPNMMPTSQLQQHQQHHQHHHYGGGMQLAAGYPMMMPQQQQQHVSSLPPRGGRAVGGQTTQNMAATHSLFHYPMASSTPSSAGVYPATATAAPRQQAMASYPGMAQPMMLQTPTAASNHNQQHMAYGEVASPPSYGYPMASYPGTTPNMTSVAMVSTPPPATASLSAIPSSPSSSVSSPVVTSMASPQQPLSTPSVHTVESTISPASPVSPTSGSASDDGESVRVTKDNRKRKNRGGSSGANNNGKDDDDDDDQSKKPVTEEEMQESKRQQRLMRNRASAQLSRERKKVYMKKLEGQLKELQNQNAALSQQLIALKNENAALRVRSETLPTSSGYVYGSGAYPGSPSSVSSDGSASPEYGYTPAPSYTHGVNSNGHKRTRLSSSSNHSSAHHQMYQLPPRVRAAGVVMFALMMSFTIFYNMAGIDFNQVKTEPEFTTPSDHPTGVVFHSRGLKTSDGDSPMVTTEDLPLSATGGLASIPSPRRLVTFPGPVATSQSAYTPTNANAGNNDSEAYALVKKEHPMTPVITSDAPVVVVKQESLGASNEDKAVDLWLYENDDSTSIDDDSSSVHSHNTAAASPLATDFELFQQWKKMIVDSNLTLDMGSSYMFCPSAIQMRPQAPAKASTTKVYPHEESGIAGRLRRAGLPLPNATAAETLEELSSARLSPSNNRLRLWVPTQSVLAGGDWDTSAFSHDAQSKLSGLTEIECQVSGIRPVIIANTATATA